MINATFLAILPAPYVCDLFDAIHRGGRVRLRVLYLEASANDTYWEPVERPDYAEQLGGRWLGFAGARLHWNPDVVKEFERRPADVSVVFGYGGFSQQRLMYHLSSQARPWVFFGERPGLVRRGILGRALRSIAQRPIRSAAGIAAVGSQAVSAFSQLAVPGTMIANLPYVCDLKNFRTSPRVAEREIRILYCGQIIPRKGVDLLLDAFYRVAERRPSIRLTLVGEGPFRERWLADLPASIRDRVEFTGFCQPKDLSPHFAAANLFVLPSRHDGWGVVVNQALAAGLPIVTTDAVGAATDFVKNGVNGFVVAANSSSALEAAIDSFAIDPELIPRMSEASIELSHLLEPDRMAERWADFLDRVLTVRGRKGAVAT